MKQSGIKKKEKIKETINNIMKLILSKQTCQQEKYIAKSLPWIGKKGETNNAICPIKYFQRKPLDKILKINKENNMLNV